MAATKSPSFMASSDSVPEISPISELSFHPTHEDRRLRATFFARLEDNPLADEDNITAAAVMQITGDSRVSKRWSVPGFREWFTNKRHIQAKAEYALDLLLDSIIELALTDDPKNVSAKVAATKLLLDTRGYTGRAAKTVSTDAEIPKDRQQLEAYVKRLTTAIDKG